MLTIGAEKLGSVVRMNKKQAREEYLRRLSTYGDSSSRDLLKPSGDIRRDAFRARNLSEETLADQVLKNTGVPIPGNKASNSEIEKFSRDILAENYPELADKLNIELNPELKDANALYRQDGSTIVLNPERARKDPVAFASDLFHETGHGYDLEKLKHDGKEINDSTFRKIRSSISGDVDPTDVYEKLNEVTGHHAKIPGLRDGSFGLGALKSYITSGKFRGVAPTLVKGAAAGAGGLASLAAEASDAEDVGESTTQENAMLSERNQDIRDKKMLEAIPDVNKDEAQQELEDMRRGVRRSALTDLLKK